MIDAILISIICGFSVTFAGLLLKYAFRSKCTHVNLCWGFVNIDRDPEAETKEEKLELEHGINLSETSTPK
ncbi:MAG: hypothetical protein WCJ33_03345 [Pseudomonadota bacterium]